jgi:choline transport protein
VNLYITYLLACGLLLYRRVRGEIGSNDDDISTSKYLYTWGPWRIRGLLGIIINSVACLYLILIIFFTFWPPFAAVTAVSMNYGSTVFGAAVILSGLYYAVSANKTYKGPLVEVGLLQ